MSDEPNTPDSNVPPAKSKVQPSRHRRKARPPRKDTSIAAGGLQVSRRRLEKSRVRNALALSGLKAAPGAPPSIAELARALKHDVDLIYEWVYSNVDYYPLWGFHKGALGALIDGVAGPCDQAALMVELLRESGYTANYMQGQVRLTSTVLQNLLGTNDSIVSTTTEQNLVDSQIPFTAEYDSGDLVYADLDHIWVAVEISGTTYVFDPALKSYTYIEGINIGAAVGYDHSALETAVLTGADYQPTDFYIQDFGTDALEEKCAEYSVNLLTELQTEENFAKSTAEVIGGRVIDPLSGTPLRQTELPYQTPGETPEPHSAIPDELRCNFSFSFEGIAVDLFTDEFYGKRLTISFNGSDEPELRLDGDLLGTGGVLDPDAAYGISFEIDHPFAADYGDEEWMQTIFANGVYFLAIGVGRASQSMVDYHRKALLQNTRAGGAEGDEDVLGESLAVLFYMRQAQLGQLGSIYDQLAVTQTFWYHMGGIVGYNEQSAAPYFDFATSFFDTLTRNDDDTVEARVMAANDLLAIGLDAGILQQNYGVVGINTMRLLKAANAASQKIFDTDSSSWASTSVLN